MPVTAQPHDTLVAITAGATLAAVLLTGVIASFLTAQEVGEAQKLEQDVATLRDELRTGAPGQALARLKTVESQLGTFTGFLKDAPAWPDVLDELTGLLPGTIKLTAASFDADRSVRIEGEAASQQDVATLMAALDQSTRFGRPVLDSVALNESVDGSVVVFSLTTELQAAQRSETTPAGEPSPTPSDSGPSSEPSAGPDTTGLDASTGGGPDAQ